MVIYLGGFYFFLVVRTLTTNVTSAMRKTNTSIQGSPPILTFVSIDMGVGVGVHVSVGVAVTVGDMGSSV